MYKDVSENVGRSVLISSQNSFDIYFREFKASVETADFKIKPSNIIHFKNRLILYVLREW